MEDVYIINLLIISWVLAVNLNDVHEGISARCAGLYGSFVSDWKKQFNNSRIYWYSCKESCLYEINGNRILPVAKMILPLAVFRAFKETSNFSIPRLVTIMGYPYGLSEGIPKKFFYFLTLIYFKLLKTFNLMLLIIDNFDPPLECGHVFGYRHSIFVRILFYVTDFLSMKGNFIITLTQSYKIYLSKKYKLQKKKIFVIPTGTLLIDYINTISPKSSGGLKVLYSGSLLPEKDIQGLIRCIRSLRNKNCEIELVLVGRKYMKFDSFPWLKYKKAVNLIEWGKQYLESSDICVIPYPRKFHNNYTSLAKTADYMAAGKPIVSMDLYETTMTLRDYKYGLIAKDWNEFENRLYQLYKDRQLAQTMGRNGRKAAENEFDYRKLSNKLEFIVLTLMGL